MRAHPGDRIILAGELVDQPTRAGEVLEARGADGRPTPPTPVTAVPQRLCPRQRGDSPHLVHDRGEDRIDRRPVVVGGLSDEHVVNVRHAARQATD